MNRRHLSLVLLTFAAPAHAQRVEHYWDFSTVDDVVGGVPTTAVGLPDRSVHPTYGEAYPGAGPSLNTVFGGVDRLVAAIVTGPTSAMDWGQDSFSISYWAWDDLAGDGDPRGPRVCDTRTNDGFHVAMDVVGDWNLRIDDDAGGTFIFRSVTSVRPPVDRWHHLAAVVDRGATEVRVFVDGALAGTAPLLDQNTGVPLAGNVVPDQDLSIGALDNGGGTSMQSAGIDDLAFFRGVLSEADAMALATGALDPTAFRELGTRFCAPAVVNSTGAPAAMSVDGSDVVADNDVSLGMSSLPANSFGFFLTSRTQGMVANPGGSQGVLCLGGAIGRYVGAGQIQNSGGAGALALTVDLTQHPTPNGLVPVVAGETWSFQGWYRDAVMGSATSNFSDGVAVTFR